MMLQDRLRHYAIERHQKILQIKRLKRDIGELNEKIAKLHSSVQMEEGMQKCKP